MTDLDFQECPTCAAKPGSPALCDSCLNNRYLISEMKRNYDELMVFLKDFAPDLVKKLLKRWNASNSPALDNFMEGLQRDD
jgi:hypothetical protein